jgi:hypothetical protein
MVEWDWSIVNEKIFTVCLVVATLVIARIIAPLCVLAVALLTLLTVLRIATVASLGALVIVILICRLVVPASVLWELLAGLEGLGSWLERVCARAKRGLLRVVVQVHLLCLSREVVILSGRVVFPRVEFRHGCAWKGWGFWLMRADSKWLSRCGRRGGAAAGITILSRGRDVMTVLRHGLVKEEKGPKKAVML